MAEKAELQTAKGVRDVPAEELLLRKKLMDALVRIFERYGYNPLETPIIERWETLSVKFGAGADSDAMNEIFRFRDQGNRELGLRFELTLSMARYVAMNPNIKLPFKRYEMGRVYRDGPIKLGRTREFWQCDVDIVGTGDMIADAELMKLSLDAFKALGLDAYIEVNTRKLLNAVLEQAGVAEEKRTPAVIILDKLNKIGRDGVQDELRRMDLNFDTSDKILQLLEVRGDNTEKFSALKTLLTTDSGRKAIAELEEMFSYFSAEEMKNIVFCPSLARGLAYYTGPVFEGFLRDSEFKGSICGGGRYDDMIGMFLQGKEKVPATGISFGLVPIMEALKLKEKSDIKTVTRLFVIPIGKTKREALGIAQELRSAGVNTDIDLISRGISKNLDYANSTAIPFVLFVGERELKEKKVKLRDMKSGKEELLTVKAVAKRLSE